MLQRGSDLGTAPQVMVTAIVEATDTLVMLSLTSSRTTHSSPRNTTLQRMLSIAVLVNAIADLIQNNALLATVLGFIVLGTIAIRFGREAIRAVVSWLRGIF